MENVPTVVRGPNLAGDHVASIDCENDLQALSGEVAKVDVVPLAVLADDVHFAVVETTREPFSPLIDDSYSHEFHVLLFLPPCSLPL